MSSHLYIEGAESKEDQIRCREGFRKLLEKAGFEGRLPRLSACGSRNSAFSDFQTAHKNSKGGDFVAMLIDSEDPVADPEQAWLHLKTRDGWERPVGVTDEQVLLMTTTMETWVVADRDGLHRLYTHELHANALPPTNDLENRTRDEVFDKLKHATRDCSNKYQKGKRSFIALAELDPTVLKSLLPSFARAMRVLDAKL